MKSTGPTQMSAQQYSSYSRVVKCDRTSNGKSTGGGNQKIGNPYLKWVFNQIVIRSSPHSEVIKRFYEKLQSKHGPRRARSIISHKFAVAIYYMLKNGKAFDEKEFIQSYFKNK